MATIIPASKGTAVTTAQSHFLDITQAKDLAGEGEKLRELMQTFAQSLDDEIQSITSALAANDPVALEFSLHTLKGFMAMFVVPSLALQVELLYNNCRHQPLGATAQEFNSLVPNLRMLSREVRGWLSL